MTESPQSDPESASHALKTLSHAGDPSFEIGEPDEVAAFEVVEPVKRAPGPQLSHEEHHTKATKLLALLLFWSQSTIFAAHLASVLWLARDKPNSVEEVSRVFNTWIPVFSVLFGSAATFYFTQGRK